MKKLVLSTLFATSLTACGGPPEEYWAAGGSGSSVANNEDTEDTLRGHSGGGEGHSGGQGGTYVTDTDSATGSGSGSGESGDINVTDTDNDTDMTTTGTDTDYGTDTGSTGEALDTEGDTDGEVYTPKTKFKHCVELIAPESGYNFDPTLTTSGLGKDGFTEHFNFYSTDLSVQGHAGLVVSGESCGTLAYPVNDAAVDDAIEGVFGTCAVAAQAYCP